MADRNRIPDAKLTASTIYSSSFQSFFGRLHETRGSNGWCPKTTSDRRDFLQVDMGNVFSVCGVATQGKSGEWSTSYKIQFSSDGATWNPYRENNEEKVKI